MDAERGIAPDWNLVADFTGGGLATCPSAPTNRGLAIDATGNVWVTIVGGGSGGGLAELSPTGVPISPSGGFTNALFGLPDGLAIDNRGNIWVARFGTAATSPAVIEVPVSNRSCSSSSSACRVVTRNINKPSDVAISELQFGGQAWVDDFIARGKKAFCDGGALTEMVNSTPPFFSSADLVEPEAIATDSFNNVWLSNSGNMRCTPTVPANIMKFQNGTTTPYIRADVQSPFGIAITSQGKVWEVDEGTLLSPANDICHSAGPATGNPGGCAHLTELDTNGDVVSPAGGFTGEGMNVPFNLAMDGGNNLWVTDDATFCSDYATSPSGAPGQIEEFNSAGAPVLISQAPDLVLLSEKPPKRVPVACGVQDPRFIISPECGIASDRSGNVWAVDLYRGGVSG